MDENMKNKTNSKAAKRQRQKQKKVDFYRWYHVQQYAAFTSYYALLFQATEKVNIAPEANRNGQCAISHGHVNDERPPTCQTSKKNTRQKKASKEKSQEKLTERENVKNNEKTLMNGVKTANRQGLVQEPDEKVVDVEATGAKQDHQTENHVNKRRKGKEKKGVVNRSSKNDQERRIIVNGSCQETGDHVAHTCGVTWPVREEAEPKHCGEEAPAQETRNENHGKKPKSRKKKKGQCLGEKTVQEYYNLLKYNFVETPRKFIIAKLSIREFG